MIEILIFLAGLTIGSIAIWFVLKSKTDIQINAILTESNIKLTSLQNQNNLQKEHYTDKLNTLESSKDQMKQEFENLSNKIFDQNNKE